MARSGTRASRRVTLLRVSLKGRLVSVPITRREASRCCEGGYYLGRVEGRVWWCLESSTPERSSSEWVTNQDCAHFEERICGLIARQFQLAMRKTLAIQ